MLAGHERLQLRPEQLRRRAADDGLAPRRVHDRFTVTTQPNGARPFSSLNPRPFPTWPGAYNGNHAYTSTPGKPALYQTANGGGDVVTLTNITVTDSTGAPVSGYGFVVADAESTEAPSRRPTAPTCR